MSNLELNLFGGFELRAAHGKHPQLSSMAISVFEILFGAYCDQGEAEAALRAAQRLLRLDPLRENMHRAVSSRSIRTIRACMRRKGNY